MATNFWLHTFEAVPMERMVRRLFLGSAPALEIIGDSVATRDATGLLVRVGPPDDDYAEATLPDGTVWSREGMQTTVSMRVDDDTDHKAQYDKARQFAQRIMDTGPEDVILAYEEHLLARRIDGVVETFPDA